MDALQLANDLNWSIYAILVTMVSSADYLMIPSHFAYFKHAGPASTEHVPLAG